MPRALALLAALLLAPLAAAQQPIALMISPAAEPKPALRYELLPSARERVPGDAAQHYLKALLNRPSTPDRAKATEEEKRVIAWEEADLDALPAADVRKHLARYAAAFREVEHGARCRRCEWETTAAGGHDAVADAVAGVQGHRELMRFLSLRARAEMAEKRYDDAARTIGVGLQYGKHVGEGPSLIQMMVGTAIGGLFLARIDEFVARPDAPNLYWALSALPRPFVDPRPALDGEDALSESFLPGLAELRKGPASAERALDVVENAVRVFGAASEEGGPWAKVGLRVVLGGAAALRQADAKKRLADRGWGEKDLAAMPAVQAVFLDSFETYRELADDHRKWFLMPYPEAFDGLAKAAARSKLAQKERQADPLAGVFIMILPAVDKAHQAGARIDRKVAALRAVEAARLHAAATNALPAALADVRKVPVPDDPLTGKPFASRLDAGTLTVSAPPAGPNGQGLPELKYELKLRK